MNINRRFYVYILYREDAVTPFYVGKGCGNRWMDHQRKPRRGQGRHKDNIICDMLERNIQIPKIKVADGMTAQQANGLEISLIRAIGRRPNGPLVNATAGGDGVVEPSQEFKDQQRERTQQQWKDPEKRAALIAGSRRRFSRPEEVKRLQEIGRQVKMTDEAIARRAASLRIALSTPEHKERKRQAMLKRWADRKAAGHRTLTNVVTAV